MKPGEIKKLIGDMADEKRDASDAPRLLEEAGVSFDFSEGFTDKVIGRISGSPVAARKDAELRHILNYAFSRVAITGAAAIIILMISIFITQDSFSFNSFLGIGDSLDESIGYLITGY